MVFNFAYYRHFCQQYSKFQAHLVQPLTETVYGSLMLNSLAGKCKSCCSPQVFVTCSADRNILSAEWLEVPR